MSSGIQNQNSQMFFDFSVRMIRHTHFFFSLFVDEFSTSRISDPDVHNFYYVRSWAERSATGR